MDPKNPTFVTPLDHWRLPSSLTSLSISPEERTALLKTLSQLLAFGEFDIDNPDVGLRQLLFNIYQKL